MPSKHHSLGESIDKDHVNGSTSGSVNRTGSSPGLAAHCHTYLQKPVMLRSSSADQPSHPLIVFEKAPNSSHSETSLAARQKGTPESKTSSKHQKYLKPDDDEAIPLNLEQIVIHSLPKAPVRRGILRREDTITSTVSSLSEQEQPCWDYTLKILCSRNKTKQKNPREISCNRREKKYMLKEKHVYIYFLYMYKYKVYWELMLYLTFISSETHSNHTSFKWSLENKHYSLAFISGYCVSVHIYMYICAFYVHSPQSRMLSEINNFEVTCWCTYSFHCHLVLLRLFFLSNYNIWWSWFPWQLTIPTQTKFECVYTM